MINMDKKIIYVAEIDADVDDIVAVEYLANKNVLEGIVLDPVPTSTVGLERIEQIKKMGIKVFDEIPKCDYIFVGGAFTKLANYLRRNRAVTIVANGGFVGQNLVKEPLEKFKGKKYIRTFNFNMDVHSTIQVLNSRAYDNFYLIGKNVCHSEKNTIAGIWKDEKFLNKYHLKTDKRLHDLLAVQEGIKIINNDIENSLLVFEKTNPIYEKLDGKFTKWGSEKGTKAISAIGWK